MSSKNKKNQIVKPWVIKSMRKSIKKKYPDIDKDRIEWKCLNCRNGYFKIQFEKCIEQEYNGEIFIIESFIEVCQNCGWRKVTDEQAEEIARKTVDAHNKKHENN